MGHYSQKLYTLGKLSHKTAVAVAEVVHEQEIDLSRLFLQSLQDNRF